MKQEKIIMDFILLGDGKRYRKDEFKALVLTILSSSSYIDFIDLYLNENKEGLADLISSELLSNQPGQSLIIKPEDNNDEDVRKEKYIKLFSPPEASFEEAPTDVYDIPDITFDLETEEIRHE